LTDCSVVGVWLLKCVLFLILFLEIHVWTLDFAAIICVGRSESECSLGLGYCCRAAVCSCV
jgi:hypothetical protein